MKTRISLFMAALLCAAFTLASCSSEVKEAESYVTLADVSQSAMEFSGQANTATVKFSASGDWKVESSDRSWLTCIPMNGPAGDGTITLQVSKSDIETDREGSLTIMSGTAFAKIKVTQHEKGQITFSPESVDMPMDGGTTTISILTNMSYDVTVDEEAQSWITVVSTKAMSEYTVTLSVAANDVYATRIGKVYITTEDGVTGTFTVSQKTKETDTFDENAIVASIGTISDTHVDGLSTTAGTKFNNALAQLRTRGTEGDSDGLDAVLIVGDLINNGYSGNYGQIDYFKSIYEQNLDPAKVPMIYTIGNHDASWNSNMVTNAKNFRTKLGSAYYATEQDSDMATKYECCHSVVKGTHVLCISPNHSGPVTYDYTALTWLDTQLKTITKADPSKYVIVLTHPMIHNTVYGSTLVTGGYCTTDASVASSWYTVQLTSILKKYPQAIVFGGHLHFPINEPRSLWQGDFTALGCGSVSYMAFEGGTYYANKASGTTLADRQEFSQGYLLQIDASGNMRIKKLDFYRNQVFENDWVLSRPDVAGSNLKTYANTSRAARNQIPLLSTLEVEKSDVQLSVVPYTAKWASATDDEFAHHYELSLTSDNGYSTIVWIMADYYLCDKISDMKKEWSYDLGSLTDGTYTLSLKAVDSWGAVSNTLTKTFTVKADPSGGGDSSTLPDAYVDLSFDNSTIKDTKGKVSITNHGATSSTTSVSFDGKTYQEPALNVTTGNYARCQFTELTSAALMKSFAAGGFSVEAFYVEKASSSGVQAIVCGTESGGWGLAERATGVPYFIVGDGASSNSYKNADATAAASRTSLNHVICVYDPAAKMIYLYVNGALKASAATTGVFFTGTGDSYNRFCLGADIKNGDATADFQSVNATIVDAKIYSCALNAAQVKLAYDAAVAAL